MTLHGIANLIIFFTCRRQIENLVEGRPWHARWTGWTDLLSPVSNSIHAKLAMQVWKDFKKFMRKNHPEQWKKMKRSVRMMKRGAQDLPAFIETVVLPMSCKYPDHTASLFLNRAALPTTIDRRRPRDRETERETDRMRSTRQRPDPIEALRKSQQQKAAGSAVSPSSSGALSDFDTPVSPASSSSSSFGERKMKGSDSEGERKRAREMKAAEGRRGPSRPSPQIISFPPHTVSSSSSSQSPTTSPLNLGNPTNLTSHSSADSTWVSWKQQTEEKERGGSMRYSPSDSEADHPHSLPPLHFERTEDKEMGRREKREGERATEGLQEEEEGCRDGGRVEEEGLGRRGTSLSSSVPSSSFSSSFLSSPSSFEETERVRGRRRGIGKKKGISGEPSLPLSGSPPADGMRKGKGSLLKKETGRKEKGSGSSPVVLLSASGHTARSCLMEQTERQRAIAGVHGDLYSKREGTEGREENKSRIKKKKKRHSETERGAFPQFPGKKESPSLFSASLSPNSAARRVVRLYSGRRGGEETVPVVERSSFSSFSSASSSMFFQNETERSGKEENCQQNSSVCSVPTTAVSRSSSVVSCPSPPHPPVHALSNPINIPGSPSSSRPFMSRGRKGVSQKDALAFIF